MYIGIDLGSTNIKAAIYNENMELIDRQSLPVEYIRKNGLVEFDAIRYVQDLEALLSKMLQENQITNIRQMAFTGQAESLVVLGKDGLPLTNAISWMDERSTAECEALAKQFSPKQCEEVTGQLAVLPTWPATKILWLKHNRPEVFQSAETYMLLKDYVVYYFTGIKKADMSIATFSFYFDIYNKIYWQEMLDAIGVREEQLPKLCEPCSIAGDLLPEISDRLGLNSCCQVNVGTLDHFAGMIGTGNITPGNITLSTGTVMAMAVMCKEPAPKNTGIAMHYGFLPDTHVMLPVAESGGISLEWFRRSCMLFLPYLVGTNAPEFDSNATGVFWGLRQEHDAYDMARAVMEGVSFVLRKNCDYMAKAVLTPSSIIATGGGAKSAIWCQMQADITGLKVRIPTEKEAACLGAAIVAAVADNRYNSLQEAVDSLVAFSTEYTPNTTAQTEEKYSQFCALYDFTKNMKP